MFEDKEAKVVSEQFLVVLSCVIILIIVGMGICNIKWQRENVIQQQTAFNITNENIMNQDMQPTSRSMLESRKKQNQEKIYEFSINDETKLYFKDLGMAEEKKKYLLDNTNGLNIIITEMVDKELTNKENIENTIQDYYNKYKKPEKCFPTISHSISSMYGYRKTRGDFHSGIDLQGHYGDNIYAYKKGIISKVQYSNRSYGNMIIVTHNDNTQSRYAHLSSINVANGQQVECGQIIGKMGSTGNSTGNHLHFEIIINGKTVNPYNYIF